MAKLTKNQLILLRQKELFSKLTKEYYMPHELMTILDMDYQEAKESTKGLMKTKEGYSRLGVIANLMGGVLYAN